MASAAITGGCVADGRLNARGADGTRGPWTALLPVPGAGVCACTDCRAFNATSRRRTPRECRKVLTWCPEAESHAAALLRLPRDGSLLSAWFTGHEGMSDVAIAVSRLGLLPNAVWAVPQLVSSARGRSAQNPVLFQTSPLGARVHLLHTSHLQDMGQGSSEIYHLMSHDGGVTWGEPTKVTARGMDRRGMFLRAPPLVLPPADGGGGARVLLPVYHTPGNAKTHYSEMLEYVILPDELAEEAEAASRGVGDGETTRGGMG